MTQKGQRRGAWWKSCCVGADQPEGRCRIVPAVVMTTSADIDAMRAQMQVGADGTTPAASAGLFGTFQNGVPGCSVRNVPVTLAT